MNSDLILQTIISAAVVSATVSGIITWISRLQIETKLLKQKSQLDAKHEHTKAKLDHKVETYRLVIDNISSMLSDIDFHVKISSNLEQDEAFEFNKNRMRIYGYLGLFAPQPVMNAYDNLIDMIIKIIYRGEETYEWDKIRNLVLALLNEVRKDLGFEGSSFTYNGTL